MAIGKPPVQWTKAASQAPQLSLKTKPDEARPVDRGYKPAMGLKALVEQPDSADLAPM